MPKQVSLAIVETCGQRCGDKVDAVKAEMETWKAELLKADVQLLSMAMQRLKVETQDQFKETRRAILQGIYEATEVKTPTTFVILSEQLEDDKECVGVQDLLKESGEGIGWEKVRLDNNVLYEKAEKRYRRAMRWVQKGLEAAKGVYERHGSGVDVLENITKSLGELVTDTMYFYLVDELTGEPVSGGVYTTRTNSRLVPELLPLMLNTMRATIYPIDAIHQIDQIVRHLGLLLVVTTPTRQLLGKEKTRREAHLHAHTHNYYCTTKRKIECRDIERNTTTTAVHLVSFSMCEACFQRMRTAW